MKKYFQPGMKAQKYPMNIPKIENIMGMPIHRYLISDLVTNAAITPANVYPTHMVCAHE